MARHATTAKLMTVIQNPWTQTPPVQSVAYSFNKGDYPLPHNTATVTAQSEDLTTAASGIAASAISTLAGSRYAASVDKKLEAFEAARDTSDSDFTARMNEIEDKLQCLQDQLSVMPNTVTASVPAGLQQPGGLLGKQDAKITMLSEKLLRFLPLVEQVLGLCGGNRSLSPTDEADSVAKKQKLDDVSPMTGVQSI
jgi:uncharacterized phage infection (PIP) family protein YhgE